MNSVDTKEVKEARIVINGEQLSCMSFFQFHAHLYNFYLRQGNEEKAMLLYWIALSSLTPEQHKAMIQVRQRLGIQCTR